MASPASRFSPSPPSMTSLPAEEAAKPSPPSSVAAVVALLLASAIPVLPDASASPEMVSLPSPPRIRNSSRPVTIPPIMPPVSKIERAEAIENLSEIVEASDVVMVARGDLGVEIGDAELPGLQKKIIRESLARNRVVITATQMLQSMVDSPIPTRAEVLDVANAVIDGTDAVMLSAATAAGRYQIGRA